MLKQKKNADGMIKTFTVLVGFGINENRQIMKPRKVGGVNYAALVVF